MTRMAILIASALFGTSVWAAGITVSDAWIRQLPAGVPAGGFFTVHNQGKEAVVVVGATSPRYGMVMIHRSVEEGGSSKMLSVDKVEVLPGGELRFRPGGYHLMLMRAKHEIKVGSRVPITLVLSDGRKVTAQFEVRGPTAR